MRNILNQCEGFQWDEGNADKNWIRHKVSKNECEQVFFNLPLIFGDDAKHSTNENRWYVLGKMDSNRFLFIVFTIRDKYIRIISARDMNKKERRIYYEQIKRNTKI